MADDDLTFRTLDPTDPGQEALVRGFAETVLRGFHDDRPDDAMVARWLEVLREDRYVVRGAWDDAPLGSPVRPVATVASWPGEINVGGGAVLPAHLVTDVVVDPTHRRRGLMRRLLTDDLAHAVAERRPLAALTASEGSIYGRFGFGPATRIRQVEVDTSPGFAFRPGTPVAGGRLVLVAPTEAFEATSTVYARHRTHTRGAIDRPAFYRWFTRDNLDMETRSPDPKSHTCVHLDDDGAPAGYVTYRHEGDQDGRATLRVRDLVAATPGSYLRLWRFLADVDLAERVTWNRSVADDPLAWALVDPRRVRVVRDADFLWLRVLDVATALEARPWGADADAVLDVDDALGHAAGRWRVVVREGRASVTRTDDEPDLAMDADTLGSLYLGGVTTPVLAAAGRLRGSEAAVARWTATADVGPPPATTTGF